LTAAFVDRRRPWMPVLNLLLAAAAAVIAVIALVIARADDAPPVVTPSPAAAETQASDTVMSSWFYGCDGTIGSNRC
jgi:hypothetical protein